jgi:lupus La protein
MKKHLGLDLDVKQETMPEETVLAVAEVLRRSSALRVTEDGKEVILSHTCTITQSKFMC